MASRANYMVKETNNTVKTCVPDSYRPDRRCSLDLDCRLPPAATATTSIPMPLHRAFEDT